MKSKTKIEIKLKLTLNNNIKKQQQLKWQKHIKIKLKNTALDRKMGVFLLMCSLRRSEGWFCVFNVCGVSEARVLLLSPSVLFCAKMVTTSPRGISSRNSTASSRTMPRKSTLFTFRERQITHMHTYSWKGNVTNANQIQSTFSSPKGILENCTCTVYTYNVNLALSPIHPGYFWKLPLNKHSKVN